ncbi:unnamed protein product [Thlaspi arvense]|uniref:Nudix hydrolase domain-containing protein n=1 Tax=Thlaspi arvense TaxID=13288 RepID=A0AAU9SCP0_THLAR|nr:unnamed protein product [Thlaspi arvense]
MAAPRHRYCRLLWYRPSLHSPRRFYGSVWSATSPIQTAPSFIVRDAEELMQANQENAGKFVSQIGIQESTASILKDLERFRPKREAVLICIFEGDDGDLRIIFAKRSSRLCTHSEEVSLPGGKAEEDDRMTATREAEEEIGLDPSLVDVVTSLEPFLSKFSPAEAEAAALDGIRSTTTSSKIWKSHMWIVQLCPCCILVDKMELNGCWVI